MKNLSLTYCTNVHPLGDWASWRDTISDFGPAIRADLGWNSLPMGLWFPASLVAELQSDPDSSQRIRDLFLEKGLSAFTCNGFPYGNFHDKVVKTKVYQPDWTTRERLDYTLACAEILSEVMGSEMEGSLSTLPLGWRIGWKEKQTRAAARNILAYVKSARALADRVGRKIRLAIEPEPGCVLETVDQVLDFWSQYLRPEAKASGVSDQDLDTFCGLCYDTCHQAVQFEDPVLVMESLRDHGIPIAKMQLSSALEFKADPNRKSEALRGQFMEERFLHQTRVKTPQGVVRFDDLPRALESASEGIQDLWSHPWRVHFHVPIDAAEMLDSDSVTTTREDMLRALKFAVHHDLCRHFEVETYTWSVLPETHRPKTPVELAACIARELRFITLNLPMNSMVNGSQLKITQ